MEFRNAKNHELNECPKRQYTCPHCREAGVYDERTTAHLEVCPKVEITCKKCSLQISRCDESRHPLVCRNEPVHCTYYTIGCEDNPLRKDLGTHEEDTQLHLSLATKEILRLRKDLGTHEENTQLHLLLATKEILRLRNRLLLKNTLIFRLKFEDNNIFSPAIFTSASGYKLCIQVNANGYGDGKGTHVSVHAYLMKGDNDNSLSWPFTGTVTIELLNQLEDKNHLKYTLTFPADDVASQRVVDGERAPRRYGWNKFISHTDLAHKTLANRQYLKDDTLIFRLSAEAPNYKPWLE